MVLEARSGANRVRGAHPSKSAKGEATEFCGRATSKNQRWASPQDFKPKTSIITKAAGWNELPSEDIEGIDDYTYQMSEIDPAYYSLRYAHSKKGESSLPKDLTHMNLRHFGDLMERLANYLSGLEAAMCWRG